MATVRPVIQRSTISQKNYFTSKVKHDPITVDIIADDNILKNIKTKNSYNTIIEEDLGSVKINEKLPFRVKFFNIGIESAYGGVPPIGIAIIGFNNYIL